jgi:hypothetical protein
MNSDLVAAPLKLLERESEVCAPHAFRDQVILFAMLLPLCSACAVDPETDVRFTRTAPDGSVIEARIDRAWQGGPVRVRAEYDPASGRWVVEWTSDVELEPAVDASRAQADAQRAAFEAGLQAGIRIAAAPAALP